MKEINKKNNLLSAFAVFSFVVFAFVIANTFGTTYAASSDICPYGWDTSSIATQCTKEFSTEELCESAIEALGLTVVEQSDYNTCTSNFDGTSYKATIESKTAGSGVTFTATLNANGGTFDGSTTKTVSCEAYNEKDECTIDISDYKPTARTGYSFVGWGTTSTSTNAVYSTLISLGQSLSGKYTYYAMWEKQDSTGSDTTSCEFGTESKCEAQYGVNACEKNATTGCWDKKATTEPTQTFYATLNANNGSIVGSNKLSCTTSAGGDSCTINISTTANRSGYTFEGWGTSASCTSGKTSVTLTTDKTYYACWALDSSSQPENPGSGNEGGTTPDSGDSSGEDDTDTTTPTAQTWKATFNANGGTLSGSNTLTCTTEAGENSCIVTGLPIATRDKYTFKGWSTSTSCTSTTGNSVTSISLTKNQTFYACWNEDGYSVTFNLDGGTLYINNIKTTTTKYTLASIDYSTYTAKKDGYNFIGWSTSSTSCDDVNVDEVETLTATKKLYACYEKNGTEIGENPNTGSSLLYMVYLIGVLALTYTCYYSYKLVKQKNNN